MQDVTQAVSGIDRQSESFLALLAEQQRVRESRVNSVRTVLIVLSAGGMVYDRESLRQKVLTAYPESTVFFKTTSGKNIGAAAPAKVDLLIDLTGPGQIQPMLLALKLKRMARVTVGRNAGFFRKRMYDRVFDERAPGAKIPTDPFDRERKIQREVLALAGVALFQSGDLPPDRGQEIALELPPLNKA